MTQFNIQYVKDENNFCKK